MIAALVAMVAFFVAAKKYPSGKSADRLAAAHAKGETAHWNHYVNVWVPRASLASGVLCAVLVLGGRWFFQQHARSADTADSPAQNQDSPECESGGSGGQNSPQSRQCWALLMVTAIFMLGWGVMNAPRLNHGLWADEESTMRKYAVGDYNREADGTMKFRPVTWGDTVFRYRDPNNHIFHTVLARASHQAFGDPARDGWYFDARALRIPAFVCALGMFAAVAWLAWLLRMQIAGLFGILLLTLHPWCMQIGTEARGYSVELLLVPLALCFAVKSLRENRWPWWIALGLNQFLILWTWPAAVHLLLVLNGALLWLILRHPARRPMLARFLTAGILALIPAMHLLLPIAQPLMNYLKIPRMQGTQSAGWYADVFALITTGMPWQQWGSIPSSAAWQGLGLKVWAPMLCVVVAFLLTGARALWKSGGPGRLVLAVALLHAPFAIAHAALKGNMLYFLYVSLSMPLVVLLLAAGITAAREWLMERCSGMRNQGIRTLLPALPVIAASFIPSCTAQWRVKVRFTATEPYAAGAAATRTVRDPAHPDYDRVVVFAPAMATYGYDPGAIEFYQDDREFEEHLAGWKAAGLWPPGLELKSDDDPAAFAALARHAHESGKPFFVHVGVPGFTAAVKPKIWELIQDSALFERTAVFEGIDTFPTVRRREIYRFTGNTAALPK